MKSMLFTAWLLAAGALSLASASAITLQFAITNLAPADSLSIETSFLTSGDISDVMVTPASGGGMMVLPQLSLLTGIGSASSLFPTPGGSAGLLALFPGQTLTFSLMQADLLGADALHFGVSLFDHTPIADAAGGFLPVNLTLTAGNIAEFDANGLVVPGSGFPGPAGISASTPLVHLTVVPEPTGVGLTLLGVGVAFRRRRS